MNSALAHKERMEFSERLVAAIVAAGHDPRASKITREFNVRSRAFSMTPTGVRRWLNGESVPTQPKIGILADWLGVTPAWLRYGSGPRIKSGEDAEQPAVSREVEMIVNDYRKLDDKSRFIFDQTLSAMLSLQQLALKI